MELQGGTNKASAKSGLSPIEMEVRGVRCRSEAAKSVAERTEAPPGAYETGAGAAGGGITPTRL